MADAKISELARRVGVLGLTTKLCRMAGRKGHQMQTKTESPRHVGSSALLGIWWHSMPDWAKHAYHNCPTVNRVMKECALCETTREEMQWRVAGALYEQRNQWKETALNLKQYEPRVVKMPNIVLGDQASK